jgi:hypothetical protein
MSILHQIRVFRNSSKFKDRTPQNVYAMCVILIFIIVSIQIFANIWKELR